MRRPAGDVDGHQLAITLTAHEQGAAVIGQVDSVRRTAYAVGLRSGIPGERDHRDTTVRHVVDVERAVISRQHHMLRRAARGNATIHRPGVDIDFAHRVVARVAHVQLAGVCREHRVVRRKTRIDGAGNAEGVEIDDADAARAGVGRDRKAAVGGNRHVMHRPAHGDTPDDLQARGVDDGHVALVDRSGAGRRRHGVMLLVLCL